MQIGYARVSTDDLHLEPQISPLEKSVCEQIDTDKISGTRANRPGPDNALFHVSQSGTLAVWKLDRLARSVKSLVDLVAELEQRKVHFESLIDGTNTKTTAGGFFFHVMTSLAQEVRADWWTKATNDAKKNCFSEETTRR